MSLSTTTSACDMNMRCTGATCESICPAAIHICAPITCSSSFQMGDKARQRTLPETMRCTFPGHATTIARFMKGNMGLRTCRHTATSVPYKHKSCTEGRTCTTMQPDSTHMKQRVAVLASRWVSTLDCLLTRREHHRLDKAPR